MLYDQLKKKHPTKYVYVDQILDPILLFERASDHTIKATLGVFKNANGQRIFYPAANNESDWVQIDNTVFPLPVDVAELLKSLIGDTSNSLSLLEITTIQRNPYNPINIEFSDNIFVDATSAASAEDTNLKIHDLTATLYPYQSRGINWMSSKLSVDGGLILADEMGLGKSIQIIGLLLKKNIKELEAAVIVCTKTLLRNWKTEFTKFAPSINVLIHSGDDRTGSYQDLRKPDVILTTYDTIVNDLTLFKSTVWSFVIFDEAQNLKNPETQRRQAASEIKSLYRIPMTGTPVENSLVDLWSLSDLAIPGILQSLTDFSQNYPDTLENANELSELTKNFVLQRKVAQVAEDLPERIDIDVPIEMEAAQASLYKQVRQDTIKEYPQAGNLIATTRLQLLCTHPELIESEAEIRNATQVFSSTPKLDYCMSILEETFRLNQKAIIFCNYNRFYDILKSSLNNLDVDIYLNKINGETPEEARQEIVDEYSGSAISGVLVLNPKAAGAGLNITAATTVIHYTQVWNPALEAQASARAHRRGQTQPVRIYRLFYEDTVERVMINRSMWRKQLGNEAVPLSSRDVEDLEEALKIEPKL